MGGFTWSGFNCMLDTDGGYGCPPSTLAGCGLHKTEGVPRANNVRSAPLWHGRGKGWDNASDCQSTAHPDPHSLQLPHARASGIGAQGPGDMRHTCVRDLC